KHAPAKKGRTEITEGRSSGGIFAINTVKLVMHPALPFTSCGKIWQFGHGVGEQPVSTACVDVTRSASVELIVRLARGVALVRLSVIVETLWRTLTAVRLAISTAIEVGTTGALTARTSSSERRLKVARPSASVERATVTSSPAATASVLAPAATLASLRDSTRVLPATTSIVRTVGCLPSATATPSAVLTATSTPLEALMT